MGQKARFCLLLVTFLTATPGLLAAQAATEAREHIAPDALHELLLRDGSRLVGRVINDGDPLRFQLVSGAIVEVKRDQVVDLRPAEGVVRDGRLWRPDRSSNRMFFGPTGRTIDRGEGYFAVFEIVFPAVGVGITDRFSVAAGTLLLGDIGSDRPVWIIPKLQLIDQAQFDFSVGALAVSTLDGNNGSVGILFGVGTWGGETGSVTAGAGWGWVDSELADTPAILFGGDVRLGPSIKLMTENYWIPTGDDDAILLSAGPRFLGDRLSADVALAISPDNSGFFPLVNFVWSW